MIPGQRKSQSAFELKEHENALVSSRFDPAILLADPDHFGYLPAHVVRDAESLEFALFV